MAAISGNSSTTQKRSDSTVLLRQHTGKQRFQHGRSYFYLSQLHRIKASVSHSLRISSHVVFSFNVQILGSITMEAAEQFKGPQFAKSTHLDRPIYLNPSHWIIWRGGYLFYLIWHDHWRRYVVDAGMVE